MIARFPRILAISTYLRDQRRSMQLRQKQAAHRCGYSLRIWQYWETGEKAPSPRAISDIIKAFPALRDKLTSNSA
jgi:DNA-binding transcriptional regulator YiaG